MVKQNFIIQMGRDRHFHLVGLSTPGRLCRYAYMAFSSSSVVTARTIGQGILGDEYPLAKVIIGTLLPPGKVPLLNKSINCSSDHWGMILVRFGPAGGPGWPLSILPCSWVP